LPYISHELVFLLTLLMSTRTERQANKSQNERQAQYLKELCSRIDNKKCADCKVKGKHFLFFLIQILVGPVSTWVYSSASVVQVSTALLELTSQRSDLLILILGLLIKYRTSLIGVMLKQTCIGRLLYLQIMNLLRSKLFPSL
jgi:hypothetical protein